MVRYDGNLVLRMELAGELKIAGISIAVYGKEFAFQNSLLLLRRKEERKKQQRKQKEAAKKTGEKEVEETVIKTENRQDAADLTLN